MDKRGLKPSAADFMFQPIRYIFHIPGFWYMSTMVFVVALFCFWVFFFSFPFSVSHVKPALLVSLGDFKEFLLTAAAFFLRGTFRWAGAGRGKASLVG